MFLVEGGDFITMNKRNYILTKEQQSQIEDFICYKEEQEVSQNTLIQYRKTLEIFFDFVGKNDLTKRIVLDFKNWLIENFSQKTTMARLCGVNEYLKWSENQTLCVKGIKIQKKMYVENVISDEEYNLLLDWLQANDKIKVYWIVRFIAGTGVRVNELTKLTYKCLKDGYAEMHSKGKLRRIMIPKKLIEESKTYFGERPENEPLFQNRFGERFTTRGVAQQLLNYGQLAGIRKEVLHPHGLRHYFAIKMMKASNNNISLVSSYLGHSSINTTMIYTMMSKEEQEQQMNDFMNW